MLSFFRSASLNADNRVPLSARGAQRTLLTRPRHDYPENRAMLHRCFLVGSALACLSLAACTQTAAPAQPGVVGSEAIAAIHEAQAANAAAMTSIAVTGHVAALDPTRISGMASSHLIDAQMRAANEKNLRMLDEVQRLAEEAPKLQALNDEFEREQAAKKAAQRKPKQ
jgi:hypothetical protein